MSCTSIFSAKSWSNLTFRDSFGILRTCRFQNCPWFWKLTNICTSNKAKQNITNFLPLLYIDDSPYWTHLKKFSHMTLSTEHIWRNYNIWLSLLNTSEEIITYDSLYWTHLKKLGIINETDLFIQLFLLSYHCSPSVRCSYSLLFPKVWTQTNDIMS